MLEFLERSALGIVLWYYPAGNPEAKDETLEAAINRLGRGRNLLLIPRWPGPEGALFGVERIAPSLAGAEAFKQILTEYFGPSDQAVYPRANPDHRGPPNRTREQLSEQSPGSVPANCPV